MAEETVREAVGVFHDEGSLRTAVDDLLIAGFDRSNLSLLASTHAVEEKLGYRYEKVDEVEDNLQVPRTIYVSVDSRTEGEAAAAGGLAYVGALGAAGAIVATGGAAGVAIVAAAAAGGFGGIVGVVLARLFERRHAQHLQEHLEHGGLLLWVSTHGERQEGLATEVLRRAGAEHVHLHDLPEAKYVSTGGVSYDVSFMKRLGL